MHFQKKILLLFLLMLSAVFFIRFYKLGEANSTLSLVTTTEGTKLICWKETNCGWIQNPPVSTLRSFPINPAAVPSVVSQFVNQQDIVSSESLSLETNIELKSFTDLKGGIIGDNYIVLSLQSTNPEEKTHIILFDRKTKVTTKLYTSAEYYAYPLTLNQSETHVLIAEAKPKVFSYMILNLDTSKKTSNMNLSDFKWTERGYSAKPMWSCEKPETIPEYECPLFVNISDCSANTVENAFYTALEKQSNVFETDWFAFNIPNEFMYSASYGTESTIFPSNDGKFMLMLNSTHCNDDYGVELDFSSREFGPIYTNKYIKSNTNGEYQLSLAANRFSPSEGAIEIGRAEVKKGNRSTQFYLLINTENGVNTITKQDVSDKIAVFKTLLENITIKY